MKQSHVLIDYQATSNVDLLARSIAEHVAALPRLDEWRTLTVASGSFPSQLSAAIKEKFEWHLFPRSEWRAWLAALQKVPALPRLPAFGDYAIRDPGLPAGGGYAAANLRYTTNGSFLICRGDLTFKGGAGQMAGICESLIKRPEFEHFGPEFSEGDREIKATATTRNSGGGAVNWLQWGMNHHLESVARDLEHDV